MDIGLWIFSARRVPNVSEASLKSLLSNIMDALCYTTTPSGGSRPRPRSGPDSRLVGNPSLRPLTSVLNVNAERHRIALTRGISLRIAECECFFVGLSTRTNQQGIAMLRKALQAYGYEVVAIPMKGILHLKSVCTALDDHTVLVNPRHFDTAEFF